MFKNRNKAFTLAELLIALAILGVIATFTIPKVLQSQQDGKYKAMAKEVAAMISGSYDAYRLKNAPTSATGPVDLLPYMNYVKKDTTSVVDDMATLGTDDCSSTTTVTCLTLHNGGTLVYATDRRFDGTASTNAIVWVFDPDGKASSTVGVGFALYFRGKLTTYDTIDPGTSTYFGGAPLTTNPTPAFAAPWFSWN
jgi:prepilin-type N-terminal cleavage/methylation domain-containing protein